ncbi:hypothetical protein K1719_007358 [Acacia pycnantha]|nr:hypothetical protein K1719_007358 [Acacia pycnantha]
MKMKLFDAHCHLQDPRILDKTPQLINTDQEVGVAYFAVNGISEKDWHHVEHMSHTYPSVIPCFGLHPWFIADRSSNWLESLKEYFDATPSAAVGEVYLFLSIPLRTLIIIGLDKGPLAKHSKFSDQVEVLRPQLELAKELNKPASVHCVDAFDDLLQLMKSMGPFPAGIILHSYIGSAEMVPEFSKLGAYFSFSGHLLFLKPDEAKEVLKTVPCDRILLETDGPDGLLRTKVDTLFLVEGDPALPPDLRGQTIICNFDASTLPNETLNHPANILNVLDYVASLLEIPKEELAEISYKNAVRIFSYEGSKLIQTSTTS